MRLRKTEGADVTRNTFEQTVPSTGSTKASGFWKQTKVATRPGRRRMEKDAAAEAANADSHSSRRVNQ